MKENILIVEDDESINNLLKEILNDKGYLVTQAFSGTEARLILKENSFDLILLDLMLPGVGGEKIVGFIREKWSMPIIIISAKMDLDTKVNLLSLGADDFIEKPFELKEVLARVQSQLRRWVRYSDNNRNENVLTSKDLKLLTDERRVLIKGNEIKLTAKEYEILKLLMTYPKKVFTKSNLYESIWDESSYIDDNTLNVHISNIRNKISEFDKEEYIETVWGIGFKLKN